jgi:hypothetical protein
VENEMKHNQKPGPSSFKKVLSPLEKLKRRIDREFSRKRLVGDIGIDDSEFELLIQYVRNVFYRLK